MCASVRQWHRVCAVVPVRKPSLAYALRRDFDTLRLTRRRHDLDGERDRPPARDAVGLLERRERPAQPEPVRGGLLARQKILR